MADFVPESDEDWLDDFPLATLRLIDGPDRLEDAETDFETATTTVLDYFYLFFTTSFIGQLVARTNEYAAKVRAAKPEKNKMKWAPLDSGILKKFIGLTLLMGVIKKPRIKDYWSTKPPLATPYFNWTMPRDRFTTILR